MDVSHESIEAILASRHERIEAILASRHPRGRSENGQCGKTSIAIYWTEEIVTKSFHTRIEKGVRHKDSRFVIQHQGILKQIKFLKYSHV